MNILLIPSHIVLHILTEPASPARPPSARCARLSLCKPTPMSQGLGPQRQLAQWHAWAERIDRKILYILSTPKFVECPSLTWYVTYPLIFSIICTLLASPYVKTTFDLLQQLSFVILGGPILLIVRFPSVCYCCTGNYILSYRCCTFQFSVDTEMLIWSMYTELHVMHLSLHSHAHF
jgi:hypothetical protein